MQPQKAAQREFYDRHAAHYHHRKVEAPQWQAFDRGLFEFWVHHLSPGQRVLDLGCGTGRCLSALRMERMVGADISRGALEFARTRTERRFNLLQADAERLPFRDRSFDAILGHGVLHHLTDPSRAIRECARLLTPGGLYLGHETNRHTFYFRPPDPAARDPSHRTFDAEELREAFENAGFRAKVASAGHSPAVLFARIAGHLPAAHALFWSLDKVAGGLPPFRGRGFSLLIGARREP